MNPITPAVALQIFELMPVAVLNFSVEGKVLYANRAAAVHPGKPAESMNNKAVIKLLLRDMALGKVKLPFVTDVELAGAVKVKGVFTHGFTGLETAFIETRTTTTLAKPKESVLAEVIALLKDDLALPLRQVSNALDKLPESPESTELQEAADALKQRINRTADLIAVFGDELLVTDDRIDLAELVASTCAELAPKAAQRKVNFAVKAPTDQLPPIYGNAKIIRRAVTECLENAIQHSRQQVGRSQPLVIRVGIALTGNYLLISITNLGAMPDQSKGIETRDSALGNSTTHAAGRLGLPLAERIVNLHGGNMRISAVGDDEVRVLLEFSTGNLHRGQAQLDIAQAQRYAADLAELMTRSKKETE
jgi:signal transduction histidine kinase